MGKETVACAGFRLFLRLIISCCYRTDVKLAEDN